MKYSDVYNVGKLIKEYAMRNDEKLMDIDFVDMDLMSHLVSELFNGIIDEIKAKQD